MWIGEWNEEIAVCFDVVFADGASVGVASAQVCAADCWSGCQNCHNWVGMPSKDNPSFCQNCADIMNMALAAPAVNIGKSPLDSLKLMRKDTGKFTTPLTPEQLAVTKNGWLTPMGLATKARMIFLNFALPQPITAQADWKATHGAVKPCRIMAAEAVGLPTIIHDSTHLGVMAAAWK